MKDNNSSTHKLLHSWYNFRIKIILEGIMVGVFSGLAVVFYRYLVEKAINFSKGIYAFQTHNKWFIPIWVILMIINGLIIGFIVKREPMSSGSGIPQVEGVLLRELSMNWFKVIIYKFLGGVLSIIGGLSLGREGPSIQIGASVGQGFSKVFKRINLEEKFLITSGASAGLAAAFNAPLSGVIFALEEVHKNFSPIVLSAALAASITADFVSKQFFGMNPVFKFNSIEPLPLKYYLYLIFLGIIIGAMGVLFNKAIIKSQDIYGKITWFNGKIKTIIPFLFACVFGLFIPEVLGGGHGIVEGLGNAEFTLKFVLILLVVKFLFTMISFGSGTPGGIFLPLLVIGALLGDIYGKGIIALIGINEVYVKNFIILAMAGYFAAIVRAPITGIVLITEMTGSFTHLLSISIVTMVAYIFSDILGAKPIYELLLERMLRKNSKVPLNKDHHKILMEMPVCLGSELEGKLIKEIQWPEKCLLVAIKRGEKEIIPKGDTKIYAGDYLIVLSDEDKVRDIRKDIDEMGQCLKM